jgi:hypothetical protein
MKLKDNFLIGVLVGIIGPSLVMYFFYLSNFKDEAFLTFLTTSVTKGLLSPLLSLCALINLGTFYLFLQFNHLYAARGVILSTFIYGFFIIILKFIL